MPVRHKDIKKIPLKITLEPNNILGCVIEQYGLCAT